MSGGHQYESATISDQATAILGNKYGDVINIHQATFLLQATQTPHANNGLSKTARHNRVLPCGRKTAETIKTYNEGDHFRQRGAVEEIEVIWERCEDLGEGTFGEVHREQTQLDGALKSRAVKVLRRRHLKHMGVDHKKELDALIDLSQPDFVHRFVEFHSWYESHDEIYLAMEYIPYGDLESHVQAGLNESDVRQIAYQVLDGLRIMHELDLSHRDIKPANIFVVQRKPIWWVKIGDFSICKRSMTRQTILRTQVGTQGYQAPEVLGLVRSDKKNMYDLKCDIWSFGCLVFEMVARQVPFPDLGTLNDYCNGKIPFPGLLIKAAGGTLLFAEFAWSMLQTDPSARPTAEQAMFLLSHRSGPKMKSDSYSEDPNILYLEDCIGRHFHIPWQYCSSWLDMESTLKTLTSYIQRDGIGEDVAQGNYELRTSQGLCLDSRNWEQSASPGLRVSMSIASEAVKDNRLQKVASDPLELPLELPLSLRSGIHDSSEYFAVAQDASGDSFEALPRAETAQQLIDIVGKAIADLAPKDPHLQTLLQKQQTKAYRATKAKSTDPCASISGPQSPSHLSDVQLLVLGHDPKADRVFERASKITEDVSRQLTKHDSTADPSSTIQESLFDGSTRYRETSDSLQRSECLALQIVPESLACILAPEVASRSPDEEDKFHRENSQMAISKSGERDLIHCLEIPSFLRVRETQILPETLNAYNVRWEYDYDDDNYVLIKEYIDHHLTRELFLHTKKVLRQRDLPAVKVYSKEHVSSLTARIDGYTNSRTAQKSVGSGYLLAQAGRSPPVPNSAFNDQSDGGMITIYSVANTRLVDWRGVVHTLPELVCQNWPTMEALIVNCFVGDSWHPMIERGYYDLVDCTSHHISKVWEPEWKTDLLRGKTVEIVPWSDAWIFNLPSQLCVEQSTRLPRVGDVSPRVHSFYQWNGKDQGCIYFTNRSGCEYAVPFGLGRYWTTFARYISQDEHGHLRWDPSWDGIVRKQPAQSNPAGLDLFVLELMTVVDARSWHWIRPGMHIYELVHPRCSLARAEFVATTADILLWRIETQQVTHAPSGSRSP